VLPSGIIDRTNRGVGRCNSFNGGFEYPGVANLASIEVSWRNRNKWKWASANHIRRSEIAHHKVLLALFEHLYYFIGYTLRTHLRLLVVCRHLWRRDHVASLLWELFLDAAVEEERDMRVFLSF